MKPTTPKSINKRVKSLLRALDLHARNATFLPLTTKGLDFVPERGNCLLNSMVQTKQHGGDVVFGFMIWDAPRQGFCEGECHAIWSDGGTWHDLTPRVDGEDLILFVAAPKFPQEFDQSTVPAQTHTHTNAKLYSDGVFVSPRPVSIPFVVPSKLPSLLE